MWRSIRPKSQIERAAPALTLPCRNDRFVVMAVGEIIRKFKAPLNFSSELPKILQLLPTVSLGADAGQKH